MAVTWFGFGTIEPDIEKWYYANPRALCSILNEQPVEYWNWVMSVYAKGRI